MKTSPPPALGPAPAPVPLLVVFQDFNCGDEEDRREEWRFERFAHGNGFHYILRRRFCAPRNDEVLLILPPTLILPSVILRGGWQLPGRMEGTRIYPATTINVHSGAAQSRKGDKEQILRDRPSPPGLQWKSFFG